MGRIGRQISSSQIIILGFAAAILIGSLLLILPWATRDGQGALFPTRCSLPLPLCVSLGL